MKRLPDARCIRNLSVHPIITRRNACSLTLCHSILWRKLLNRLVVGCGQPGGIALTKRQRDLPSHSDKRFHLIDRYHASQRPHRHRPAATKSRGVNGYLMKIVLTKQLRRLVTRECPVEARREARGIRIVRDLLCLVEEPHRQSGHSPSPDNVTRRPPLPAVDRRRQLLQPGSRATGETPYRSARLEHDLR